jgi:hypothetical protein
MGAAWVGMEEAPDHGPEQEHENYEHEVHVQSKSEAGMQGRVDLRQRRNAMLRVHMRT